MNCGSFSVITMKLIILCCFSLSVFSSAKIVITSILSKYSTIKNTPNPKLEILLVDGSGRLLNGGLLMTSSDLAGLGICMTGTY